MQFRKRLYSSKRRNAFIDRVFWRTSQALLVSFAAFFVLVWLTERPWWRITHVDVSGAYSVSTTSVTTLAQQSLASTYLYRIDRNNAILLPRQYLVEHILQSDARAKHVALDVDHLRTLKVAVTEYQPALLWCPSVVTAQASSTEGCFHADEEGYIFAPAPSFAGYPFTIFRAHAQDGRPHPVGTMMLDQDTFDAINVFRTALRSEGVVVREVLAEDHGAFRLKTDAEWDVLWQTSRDPDESVLHLMRALPEIESAFQSSTSSARYIDLRFSNKIFYR